MGARGSRQDRVRIDESDLDVNKLAVDSGAGFASTQQAGLLRAKRPLFLQKSRFVDDVQSIVQVPGCHAQGQGSRPLAGTINDRVTAAVGRRLEGLHHVKDMVGQVAAGPVGAAADHCLGHIGHTYAPADLVIVTQRDVAPLLVPGPSQAHRPAEDVGVRQAK